MGSNPVTLSKLRIERHGVLMGASGSTSLLDVAVTSESS